jgi:hypothetical protein
MSAQNLLNAAVQDAVRESSASQVRTQWCTWRTPPLKLVRSQLSRFYMLHLQGHTMSECNVQALVREQEQIMVEATARADAADVARASAETAVSSALSVFSGQLAIRRTVQHLLRSCSTASIVAATAADVAGTIGASKRHFTVLDAVVARRVSC